MGFTIFKANGTQENFSSAKLKRSLERAGLQPSDCDEITSTVKHSMIPGDRTKDIYDRCVSLLHKRSPIAAVNYSLKRALFDLGPSGHPFETYVARYFNQLGYKTMTRQKIRGHLVTHEVDVVGNRLGEFVFVECKFHNRAGIKNDIKVALYVKARRDDLGVKNFYLASNTAFTVDAITYAKGSGIHLLGVNAPTEHSFFDQIIERRLYPITSLRRLPRRIRDELLIRDVVLAQEVRDHESLVKKLGLSDAQWKNLFQDILQLEGKSYSVEMVK